MLKNKKIRGGGGAGMTIRREKTSSAHKIFPVYLVPSSAHPFFGTLFDIRFEGGRSGMSFIFLNPAVDFGRLVGVLFRPTVRERGGRAFARAFRCRPGHFPVGGGLAKNGLKHSRKVSARTLHGLAAEHLLLQAARNGAYGDEKVVVKRCCGGFFPARRQGGVSMGTVSKIQRGVENHHCMDVAVEKTLIRAGTGPGETWSFGKGKKFLGPGPCFPCFEQMILAGPKIQGGAALMGFIPPVLARRLERGKSLRPLLHHSGPARVLKRHIVLVFFQVIIEAAGWASFLIGGFGWVCFRAMGLNQPAHRGNGKTRRHRHEGS